MNILETAAQTAGVDVDITSGGQVPVVKAVSMVLIVQAQTDMIKVSVPM